MRRFDSFVIFRDALFLALGGIGLISAMTTG